MMLFSELWYKRKSNILYNKEYTLRLSIVLLRLYHTSKNNIIGIKIDIQVG